MVQVPSHQHETPHDHGHEHEHGSSPRQSHRPHNQGAGHSHAHGHGHAHGSDVIGLAFFLNLTFTLIELVGGVLTNSMAILSNAVHDLGDSVALALTWYFEKISHRSRDTTYTYGYRRWSVAAAVFSSLILCSGSMLILKEAVPRLWNPEPVAAPGMIGLAILGVLINGFAMGRLHDHGSPAEKTIRLHLLEDVLGWVVVLIGGIGVYFFRWYWLDPLMSIGVSLFILRNVFRNLRAFSRILLQAVPEDVDLDDLQSRIQAVSGVQALHDLHIWTLDSSRHVLSAHAVVAADTSRETLLKIKAEIKAIIREAGIGHDTLEMEYADEACQIDCA